MKVGILGSGPVGEALGNGFLQLGFEVMRGSRDPSKLAAWQSKGGAKARVGTFAESASFGELLVLSVKGTAAESALDLCGKENLEGKTIIDTTNPIADKPPVNGVISYFTGPNESLLERLQQRVPRANFVKAFNSIGNAFMFQPKFNHGPPTMFICGQSEPAKNQVRKILTEFGWETEDLGAVEAARAIEPLCMLWCIPGFTRQSWVHAFKFLRP